MRGVQEKILQCQKLAEAHTVCSQQVQAFHLQYLRPQNLNEVHTYCKFAKVVPDEFVLHGFVF